jgi:Molybdopterin cofactor-binding domain
LSPMSAAPLTAPAFYSASLGLSASPLPLAQIADRSAAATPSPSGAAVHRLLRRDADHLEWLETHPDEPDRDQQRASTEQRLALARAAADATRQIARPSEPWSIARERRGSTRWCCARRNFIPNDAYPYTTPVALTYDSGDYFKTLDMAVKAADYASFEQRRKGAAKRGKLRGIGISTYIEVRHGTLGDSGPTRCTRRLLRDGGSAHPTGSITVFTGSHSHGQGQPTATVTTRSRSSCRPGANNRLLFTTPSIARLTSPRRLSG